jgi:hypothetical protein
MLVKVFIFAVISIAFLLVLQGFDKEKDSGDGYIY